MPNLFGKPSAEGKLRFHYAEARKVATKGRTASYLPGCAATEHSDFSRKAQTLTLYKEECQYDILSIT